MSPELRPRVLWAGTQIGEEGHRPGLLQGSSSGCGCPESTFAGGVYESLSSVIGRFCLSAAPPPLPRPLLCPQGLERTVGACSELNGVPPPSRCPPEAQNAALFGHGMFADGISQGS